MAENDGTASVQDAATQADSGQGDIHARIVKLAHGCTSARVFYGQAFRAVAKWLHTPYATLTVRFSAELLEDHWHSGGDDPGFWKVAVEDLVNDALSEGRPRMRVYRARDGEDRVALVAAPFVDASGTAVGAMAAVVGTGHEQPAQMRLAEIRSVAAIISFCALEIEAAGREDTVRINSEAMQLLTQAAGARSQHELAFAITNNLRNRTGCNQVALALVEKNRANVLSISGFDEVRTRNPGVRRIIAAMEECIDHGRSIICQEQEHWGGDTASGYRLHRQWFQASGGSAVASVPLILDGRCAAIVSLVSRPGNLFTRELLKRVAEQVAPHIAALELVERANRSLHGHAADWSLGIFTRAFQPRSLLRRLLALLVLALGMWVAFGTMEYKVTTPCAIAPGVTRHMAAPHDGVLKDAHVIPGETVHVGQLLYELDVRDLELESMRLSADIAVSQIDIDKAVAEEDLVGAQLARAEQRVLETRLAIVQQKIDNSRVHAEIDGVVIEGDHRRHTGRVVREGDPMYVIASKGQWTAELAVAEYAMGHVEAGQVGVLACDARPDERQTCRILRLLPQAQEQDGRTVFVAEAEIDGPHGWLRPGMEGVARINAGRRPIWWIMSHRTTGFLRRKLWL